MNNSNNSKSEKQKIQISIPATYLTYPIQAFIPQCEVCEENRSDFYCTECKVHYCKKCESEVHTSSFWKKKHQEFIFQEPYVPRKTTDLNLCDKHKKELSLYCKDENELICTECYETCRMNNHSILGLSEYSNEVSEKLKIILNKIQKAEIQSNETMKRSFENQKKIKKEIQELATLIENQSDLMIQKIQKSKINHLNLLKKVEIMSNTIFNKLVNENVVKQKKRTENRNQIKKLERLKKDEKTIKLIRESKEIIEKDEEEREKERKKEQQRKLEEYREKREKETEEIRRLNQRKKREDEIRRMQMEKERRDRIHRLNQRKKREEEIRRMQMEKKKREVIHRLNQRENLEERKRRIQMEKKNRDRIHRLNQRERNGRRNINTEIEKEETHRLNQRERNGRRNRNKEKKKENEETFDPQMNSQNRIKLKNENKTAWKPHMLENGRICGKKIYSSGKHQINIKIDQFSKKNQLRLGVIKTEDRKYFITHFHGKNIYYIENSWNWGLKQLHTRRLKMVNGKLTSRRPEKIHLKKNDILRIFLDMDQKTINFKINGKNIGGWGNLPEKVNFFAFLHNNEGEEVNQITLI
ncbi:tripartite motif-containing protein [Anaeramoeba flamelloides]|uniref:Tripartite motif-containing protein n=1 Tax=Anaeramoeba flamelloides TaxID=1746091 RepID=A0ABQ8Z7V1_9EUKA|nr:tripartite motif-containing protein [Anaeramoeba flamelloides]